MTLGDALRSAQSRNLDVLRLILAASVIFSHAWPIALGPGTLEPLESATGRSLGGWAVGLFFFISGLLITGSAERGTKTRFWAARARRIVPGLSVALLFTLAIAFACGSVADFSEAVVWFARAMSLVSIEHRLTGAFADNPMPEVVNGPLWSLFYEVAAYCACVCFVMIARARSKVAVLALLLVTVLAALLHDMFSGRFATFAPLFAAFVFGMVFHIFRDRVRLGPVVLAVCSCLAILFPWSLAIGPVGLIVVTLVLSAPFLKLNYDASYGLYIYGWPVAQAIVHLLPGIAPLMLGILTILCTLPLAILSWCIVEQPSLGSRQVLV